MIRFVKDWNRFVQKVISQLLTYIGLTINLKI
jgi:hypothetical protein